MHCKYLKRKKKEFHALEKESRLRMCPEEEKKKKMVDPRGGRKKRGETRDQQST